MSNVTFECGCPASVVAVTVQRSDDPGDVDAMAFKTSGKKTIDLAKGEHWLSYRAVGDPKSDMSLEVTSGATMRKVDTTLGPDGRAAGTRKVVVGLILLALSLAGARPAAAQAAPASGAQTTTPLRDAAKHDAKTSLVTLPTVTAPSVPGLSLSVEANSTDKRGALAIVFGRAGDDRFTAGVTISGPLNDSTKSAQPLDLNGLNAGATAELGLHWFVWHGRPDNAAARALCQASFKREDCDSEEFTDAGKRREFLKANGADVDPIVVDVTASSSRTAFSYLEKNTFASGSQSHSDSSIGIALGKLTPTTGLISAGYAFAREWKPGSSATQICLPIPGTAALECKTSAIGPPKDSTKQSLTLEVRRFLINRRAAIAPRVAWDAKSKVTSLSVPVYVFTNTAANLSGGVKLGWNSRDHDVTAVLFVGPVFSFFK